MKDLDAVYRQHAQTVYKFLLSQCRDPQTAEELTQETFYQAVRSIDRFDGSCKVSVWLCQIAKHLWYQHLRKANRETELPEEAELPLVPSAEEETLDRSDQLDLLRRVHQLPAGHHPGAGQGQIRRHQLDHLRRTVLPGDWRRFRQNGDLGQSDLLPGQGTIEARRLQR